MKRLGTTLAVETRRMCDNGWGGAGHYPGGHLCSREHGHRGRCKCYCDATTTRRDHD